MDRKDREVAGRLECDCTVAVTAASLGEKREAATKGWKIHKC